MIGAATFQLPDAAWRLCITEDVLRLLWSHAQRGLFSRESVGQLYARELTGDEVVVARATRLTPAWSSWARVRFDVGQAMRERQKLFHAGWHCVGFWHTHPEANPRPSTEDRAMAQEHARAAMAETNGLVFAILGTQELPAGLRVWLHDGADLVPMALSGPVS